MQHYSIQSKCIDNVRMQASKHICVCKHIMFYVVKQYPVHIVYINLPLTCGCLIFACGVSGCLRLQANRLSREWCDLSLASAGVSHNVALHHASLQGGCHIGGNKSADIVSLGLEIALCAASKLPYKCSRNELKMLHSYIKCLIGASHSQTFCSHASEVVM